MCVLICLLVVPPSITGDMVGGGWSHLPPIIRVNIRRLLFIVAYNQPGHVKRDDGHLCLQLKRVHSLCVYQTGGLI